MSSRRNMLAKMKPDEMVTLPELLALQNSAQAQANLPGISTTQKLVPVIEALIKIRKEGYQSLQADELVEMCKRLPGYEKAHARQLAEVFPNNLDPELLSTIKSITSKLSQAAGFGDKGSEILLLASMEANAYVYPARVSSEQQRPEKVDYSSPTFEAHNVFFYTGLLKEFKEFKESKASAQLLTHAKEIGISETEISAIKEVLNGPGMKDVLKLPSKEAIAALQTELQKVCGQSAAAHLSHLAKEWNDNRFVTQDEFAAIVAHELRHLQQIRVGPGPNRLVKMSQQSHQYEYDADIGGMQDILAKAGFNPRGMLGAMEFLEHLSTSYSFSHPHSTSRVREVARVIADPDRSLTGLDKPMIPLPLEGLGTNVGERLIEIARKCDNLRTLASYVSILQKHPAEFCMNMQVLSACRNFEELQSIAASEAGKRLFGVYLAHLGNDHQLAEEKQTKAIQKTEDDIARYSQEKERETDAYRIQYLESKINEETEALQNQRKTLVKIQNGEIRSTIADYASWAMTSESDKLLHEIWPQRTECDTSSKMYIYAETAKTFDEHNQSPVNGYDPQLSEKQYKELADAWIQGREVNDPKLLSILESASRCLKQSQSHEDAPFEVSSSSERARFGQEIIYNLLNKNKPHEEVFKHIVHEFEAELVDGLFYSFKEQLKGVEAEQAERCAKAAAKLYSLDWNADWDAHRSDVGWEVADTLKPEDLPIVLNLLADATLDHRAISQQTPLDSDYRIPKSGHWFKYVDGICYRLTYPDKLPEGSLSPVIEKLVALHPSNEEEWRKLHHHEIAPQGEINPSNIERFIHCNRQSSSELLKVLVQLPDSNLDDQQKRYYRRQIVSMLDNYNPDFLCQAYGIAFEPGKKLDQESALKLIQALVAEGLEPHRLNSTLSYVHRWTDELFPLQVVALSKFHVTGHNSANIYGRAAFEQLASELKMDTESLACELATLGLLPNAVISNSDKILPTDQELLGFAARLTREMENHGLLQESNKAEFIERAACDTASDIIGRGLLPISTRAKDLWTDASTQRYEKDDAILAMAKDGLKTEDVLSLLPPCSIRNSILLAIWKNAGADPHQLSDLLVHIKGVPSLFERPSLINLLGAGIEYSVQQGRNNPEIASLVDSYDTAELAKYSRAELLLPNNEREKAVLEILNAKPELLLERGVNCAEKVEYITSLIPAGEVRDYLLLKIVQREIADKLNLPYETTVSKNIPMGEQFRAQVEYITPIHREEFRSEFSESQLKSISDLRSIVDNIVPHVCGSGNREQIARLILPLCSDNSAEQRLQTVLYYLPEPSPFRDHHLKELLFDFRASQEMAKKVESLFSTEMIKGGEMSAKHFFALQIIQASLTDLKLPDRLALVEWLCGISKETPWYLKSSGMISGVSLSEAPSGYAALSSTERTALLRELLLGKQGVFEARTSAEREDLKQFVDRFFTLLVPDGIEGRNVMQKVTRAMFDAAIPERRMHLFNALSDAYLELKKESNADKLSEKEAYELIALFLEKSGPLGCKLIQMLSEDQNLPAGLREAFAKRRSGAGAFSVTGVMQRLREDPAIEGSSEGLTVGKLLGAASMKQAHEGHRDSDMESVLKALRPTVDKFLDDDFILAQAVDGALQSEGIRLPRYFMRTLQEVIKDEKSLELEVQNQRRLAAEINGSTVLGRIFHVPEVYSYGKTWAEEEKAKGIPLDRLAADTSKEAQGRYKLVSAAVGLKLLSQVSKPKAMHADLHDGNIFDDEATKRTTLIDEGALGTGGPKLAALLRAIYFKNTDQVAALVTELSIEQSPEVTNNNKQFKNKIDQILKENTSLEACANRLSFEILDSVLPNRELRYFLKALGTGGHHIENAIPRMKEFVTKPFLAIAKTFRLAVSAYNILTA